MERQVTVEGESTPLYNQATVYFQTKTFINIEETNEYDIINHMIEDILEKIDNFQMNGSGWYFKEVKRLEIHTVEYKPMKGSSYIPLPNFIMSKNAITNIKNEDDKCFLWCVLRYLHPVQKSGLRINDLINTKMI